MNKARETIAAQKLALEQLAQLERELSRARDSIAAVQRQADQTLVHLQVLQRSLDFVDKRTLQREATPAPVPAAPLPAKPLQPSERNPESPEWLRPKAAAARMGIAQTTLWRWHQIYEGFPKPRRIGARVTVFSRKELDAFLESFSADREPRKKR